MDSVNAKGKCGAQGAPQPGPARLDVEEVRERLRTKQGPEYWRSLEELASTPEFEDLRYGRSGLNAVYNVAGWKSVPVEDETGAEVIEELVAGSIEVAAVHASAPSISRDDLVILGDPAKLVSEQNVLPFIRDAVYTKKFARIVNGVSAKLTTADLQAMNAIGSTTTPETIAREWLEKNGFLGVPVGS